MRSVDRRPVQDDQCTGADDLLAARRGDPAALERLYRRVAPAVAGYLRGQGAAEPDDLTSEAFIGVLRGLSTFEGDLAAFRSWLFTIAHRRLLDERRRLRRRPPPRPLDGDDGLPDVAPASEEALANVATQRVRRLLAGLTDDQRAVLLLRVVGDLSVEQVAAVVGKRPGAVKALQRRGLEALRRQLGARPYPQQRARR